MAKATKEKKKETKKRIEKETRFEFPSYPRCPRCKMRDSIATSTQGAVQYRRCRRAGCRVKFKIIGAPAGL